MHASDVIHVKTVPKVRRKKVAVLAEVCVFRHVTFHVVSALIISSPQVINLTASLPKDKELDYVETSAAFTLS